MTILVVILVVLGVNFIFWGTIGLVRMVVDATKKQSGYSEINYLDGLHKIFPSEVAVMITAHNEEKVIEKTIRPLLKFVDKNNIFVMCDNCNDKTAEIAKNLGVNVLEFPTANGKAGALDKGIKQLNLTKKFSAILFVDADTIIPETYLQYALPFFNNKKVMAVAGYAKTLWDPSKLSFLEMFYISHRERVYSMVQTIFKFGQTWKYLNVSPIVPGFASIYRSSALEKIEINPEGLIIEDFNMTFEIHRKKLGIIAHDPKVFAHTQDPHNFHDYFRQVKRWQLGFWQTVRRHGFWKGLFWYSLLLYITEVFLSSIMFLLLPFILLGYFVGFPDFINNNVHLTSLLLTIFFVDYLLTLVVAFFQARVHYLWYGLGFVFLRFFDALAFVYTMPKGFFFRSSGRWISPQRR